MTIPRVIVSTDYDYVIVGGGFYGCCLALYLRSISKRILLVEASDQLMQRASRVNQARIHTGFHYPRSAVTAVKSMLLHRRFLRDFPDAVVDNFQMLYAISSKRSKVTAKKFYRMFRDLGAPIEPASADQMALFNSNRIEAAFQCFEVAFDYSVLKQQMFEKLVAAGIEIRLSTELKTLSESTGRCVAGLSDGSEVTGRYLFNITYSQINTILEKANLPKAQLKHEIAELALVEPPKELNGFGITVMDGPFFSFMPYPSENLYSLTHVRYTPHESWTDASHIQNPYMHFERKSRESRYAFMLRDAERYLPCLSGAEFRKSIFEVKTVLLKNEQDDGRPILYQQVPKTSRIISILGGKIDNIYDLFDLVRRTDIEFLNAHDKFVV
jgi:glycine/D-amino acid oxidase-like deaminating enzyme